VRGKLRKHRLSASGGPAWLSAVCCAAALVSLAWLMTFCSALRPRLAPFAVKAKVACVSLVFLAQWQVLISRITHSLIHYLLTH